jgi:hypothetical protein
MVQAILEYAEANATSDVRETLQWLTSTGWMLTRAEGGPQASFGDVLLEFTQDDASVVITRDRSQWMADLRVGGMKQVDLDLVWEARARPSRFQLWSRGRSAGQLPHQLPARVSWRSEIPLALAWLRETPGAEHTLRDLAAQRAKSLFGMTPGDRR